MFSMTSLQSQNSPLRTLQTFYQPKNRAHSKNIKKTFHDFMKNSQIQQLYNPNTKDVSIIKYLDNIQRNRSLQRRPLGKHDLHSFITFRKSQNQQSQQNSIMIQNFQPYLVAEHKVYVQYLIKKEIYQLKPDYQNLKKQLKNTQQEVKDKLRFTFYNNNQKSKYIMQKYNQDQSLDQRRTNLYQNVFNRKIAQQSLLQMIGNFRQKKKKR